ncbi:MAG: hypothetical protein LBV29_08575, partial [Azoarcus sp.]|nr:hypothetical protein [Azoarcus sp.]
ENWRVTSDQIDDLLKTAKESDPATRHRNLIRLEKKCEFIPAYWYYRADAAHSALQKEGEGNFAEDIALCLERYGSFAGFFRKDPLHGSLLMFHMATMQLSPEVVYKYLNDLVEPFPRDASKRLFAALTCIRYGFYDEAAEHLQANIDLKQFEVVSRTLLTGVYEKKKNTDGQIALLQKLMEDESTSNQEILFQLGEISVGEQFLRRIVPEVSAIALKVESNLLYRLDDLLLTLPARWLLAENDLALATLYIGNHKVTPTKLKMEKEGENVAITFERIVDRKRMLKGDVVPLKIEVPTTHFPLIVTGRLEPVTEKNKLGELAGEALETLKDSKVGELVSEALGPLLVDDKLLFTLERIQSGTSCFSWKDGKMRRCVQ